MKKWIGNWIFVFSVIVCVLCFMFFLYMLKEATSQPSNRWSRGIVITDIDHNRISTSTRPRITTIPIEEENRFLVFWNEMSSFQMISVDSNGQTGKMKTIKARLGEPVKVRAYRTGNMIHFYMIESGRVSKYSYDYKKDIFGYVGNIAENANDFIFVDGNLFIASDHALTMVDSYGNSHLVCKPGGQLIDIFMDKDRKDRIRYNIAITNSDNKSQMLVNYCEYFIGDPVGKLYLIGKQAIGTNETSGFDTLLLGACGNTMNIMTSRKLQIPGDTCRRLPKGTANRAVVYSFDKNNIVYDNVRSKLVNDVTHVEPNPVKNYIDEEKFGFISSTMTSRGSKSYSINLMQYEFRNGKTIEKELLTNTREISKVPFWFKLGEKEFIQWEDRTGTDTKIMFASTDPEIIKVAGKLTWQIIWSTMLESLMPLGFSLSYLLLLFTCIMLPTFIFVMLAAIFFMNWVESNNRIAANIACGIHVLAEIALVAYFDLGKKAVISIEPLILQNAAGKIIITIALAAIAYHCLVLRFKNDNYDKSFVNQYVFFALINMVMFVLLIFPYYYV